MMTETWETDSRSPVQIRRRACLADAGGRTGPAAVLLVADEHTAEQVARALTGQPVDLHPVHDTAAALLVAGRTCPDAVVLAPAGGRLSPADFLDVLHTLDPGVRVIVGVGRDDGELAAQAAARGATVTARPFEPNALLALLSAALGAPRSLATRPLPIQLGRLRIDSVAPRMWLDDTPIRLPLREHLVLRYLAGGRYELGEALPVEPGRILGAGLAISAGTAATSMFLGAPVLSSAVFEITLPVLGDVKLVTALFFDLGIYLIVVGLVLDVLRSLGARLDIETTVADNQPARIRLGTEEVAR